MVLHVGRYVRAEVFRLSGERAIDGLELVDSMDFRDDGVEDAAVVVRRCYGMLGSLVLRPWWGVACIGSLACGDGRSDCGRCGGGVGRNAAAWCVSLVLVWQSRLFVAG